MKKLISLFIFGCTGFSLLYLGFSLVVASGGYSSMQCMGLLILGASLWSVGSGMKGFQWLQHVGLVVMACELTCSAACGIFPDQGSNLCPLRWQVGSLPLSQREVQDCAKSP